MFGFGARTRCNHGYSAQRLAGAEPLVEQRIGGGLGSVSCLGLPSRSFHPWAAQLGAVRQPMPGGFSGLGGPTGRAGGLSLPNTDSNRILWVHRFAAASASGATEGRSDIVRLWEHMSAWCPRWGDQVDSRPHDQ